VHIVSLHSDYHPTRPWWITGRYASKWLSERFDAVDSAYTAQLVSSRVTYDITRKWDLGVLASMLYSPQGASQQWAQGVEAGYQLQTNLWVSAGYNWVGFSDRDLQDSDYTNRGAFLRLRSSSTRHSFSARIDALLPSGSRFESIRTRTASGLGLPTGSELNRFATFTPAFECANSFRLTLRYTRLASATRQHAVPAN